MTKISAALIKEYEASDFIFYPDNGIDILKVGKKNKYLDKILKKEKIQSAVFITAWNPFSKNLIPKENKKRQDSLIKFFSKKKIQIIFGQGRSQDLKCFEDSILALGISKKDAIKFGKKFKQNAVVLYERENKAELLFCNT
jgi:hypothetical protein